ncbi:MAG TPA: MBL fold metallo-hydrolase [Kiritimatiellia bacterium]|jgi:phosphoribosyl 1,2-cyclic phosphodiesterase
MKLILGGVRGTNPVSQPEFMKYGGETTSLLIEGDGGERIIIDAGTGVRVLGDRIAAGADTSTVLILMTHYHLDHMMGLPSLGLIYDERWAIDMAAPDHGEFRVDQVMPQILARPFWPLQVEHLESLVRFTRLPGAVSESPHEHGSLRIRWCPVRHPGGCTAYRIDEPSTGESIVVATDVEWAEASAEEQRMLFELCAGPTPASILIMDGQYTPEEYPKYKGWGHSTWKDACNVARETGSGRLLVTHHGPYNDDAALLEIEKQVWKYLSTATLARERTIFSLDGDDDQPTQPFTSRGGRPG